jgi:protein involved in polysaccharide export with SLBB domain
MRKNGLLLLTLLCALCSISRADTWALDPLAKPSSRLGPKYAVALTVSIRGLDEEELCKTFSLDEEGRIQLTIGNKPIDKIDLKGSTATEAEQRIRKAIEKYFAMPPDVRVGIARVPRIRVLVTGATASGGYHTLVEGAHLSDAFAAAPFLATANLSAVAIARTEKDGTKASLVADFNRALQGQADNVSDPVLQNGDHITLDSVQVVKPPKTIAVQGAVKQPGYFPFSADMTVRDALMAAGDMLPNADPEQVTIHRIRTNSSLIVNGARAKQYVSTDNLKLQADDLVMVMPRDTGNRFAIMGAVAAPVTTDYTKPVMLSQAIVDVGGFRPEADRKSVILFRNMLRDPAHPQPVQIDYDKIASGKAPDIPLQPGDVVQVPERRKSPNTLANIGMFLLRWFLPL